MAVMRASGTVSYRVVAKRADIKGERLAMFTLPKINHPDPDKLPKPEPPRPAPEAPTRDATRSCGPESSTMPRS